MTHLSPGEVARALGGRATGNQVTAPGPGHSPRDRSLSVLIDPASTDGFAVHSFAQDDPITCRDYVRSKLGMPAWQSSSGTAPTKFFMRSQARPAERDRTPRPKIEGVQNPKRSPPDADGKPYFIAAEDVPRQSGEIRRHVYKRGGEPVRMKIKTEKRDGEKRAGFMDWYRVRDGDGMGWQARKPEGFVPCPYLGQLDPFDPEHVNDVVLWPEGEKDVDTLTRQGIVALTYGGTSDVPAHDPLLKGRRVVILADNDDAGRKCAAKKLEALNGIAEWVKVIEFPDVPERGDVSDWLADLGTIDELMEMIDDAQTFNTAAPVKAIPFEWVEPADIPPREWIYGYHYIRQFVTTTIAPGGVGKTALGIAEALAIATGKPLLGITPDERTNVWVWNGEDPEVEMKRRVAAAISHYRLTRADVEGRLFLGSGRDAPIVIAAQTKDGTTIAEPIVEALKATIRENRIGLMIIDPFVSSHSVTENDNNAIDRVVKTWAQIADETNCSIELVHHARKTNGNEVGVEDGRGAVALLSAARAARALNTMSKEDGDKFGVENHRLYFRAYDGKANLAPPSEKSAWFQIQGVALGNTTAARPAGDSVGVVEAWEPPKPLDDITVEHMHEVRRRITNGRWRKDAQSQKEPWVGVLIADVARLDLENPKDVRTVKATQAAWMKSGALKVVAAKDPRGDERDYVVAGEWVD